MEAVEQHATRSVSQLVVALEILELPLCPLLTLFVQTSHCGVMLDRRSALFPTKLHVVVDVLFPLACLDQVRNLLTKLRADKKKQVRVRRVWRRRFT